MGGALLAAVLMLLVAVLLPAAAAPAAPAVGAAAVGAEGLPTRTLVQSVVPSADGYVVALAFAPDGRLFYTTKGGFGGVGTGTVRIVENGQLRPTPFLSRPVATDGERGLLGIALDPNFASPANRYVYLYMSEPGPSGTAFNRVYRFAENSTTQTAIEPGELLFQVQTGLPTNHNGGNLHFGPDGKLYVTVGDLGDQANAPNLGSAAGKIHRLNPDGSVPTDNPFVGQAGVDSRIWSFGHRNSFDFTFDPAAAECSLPKTAPSATMR